MLKPSAFTRGFAAITLCSPLVAVGAEDEAQVQVIQTDKVRFLFDLKAFTVKADKPVVIRFNNLSPIPHNFLLVKIGKLEAVGALIDQMLTDPKGIEKGYKPESDDIIASSKLLMSDQSEEISFIAPTEPGDYPFMCTFPGHWRRMNGIMTVE
ncbi:MAG: plastocyanin/azurin family copper-binding protein [Verrucomicrobiales bacterium]